MVVLNQGNLVPKEHFCDASGVHSTPPQPSSPRHPEQPCSLAKGAFGPGAQEGVLCTAKHQAGGHMADLAVSHPRPMGGGQPMAGGGGC